MTEVILDLTFGFALDLTVDLVLLFGLVLGLGLGFGLDFGLASVDFCSVASFSANFAVFLSLFASVSLSALVFFFFRFAIWILTRSISYSS